MSRILKAEIVLYEWFVFRRCIYIITVSSVIIWLVGAYQRDAVSQPQNSWLKLIDISESRCLVAIFLIYIPRSLYGVKWLIIGQYLVWVLAENPWFKANIIWLLLQISVHEFHCVGLSEVDRSRTHYYIINLLLRQIRISLVNRLIV